MLRVKEKYRSNRVFLNRLGEPNETRNGRGLYWEDVPFQEIVDEFFRKFKFNEQSDFSNMEPFFEWYQKEIEAGFSNWNVVLSGSGKLDDISNENNG